MDYKKKYLENLHRAEERKAELRAKYDEKIKNYSETALDEFKQNLASGFAGAGLYQSYYFKHVPVIIGELKQECKEVGIKIREEIRKMGFTENEIRVKSQIYFDNDYHEKCIVVLEDLSDKPVSRFKSYLEIFGF